MHTGMGGDMKPWKNYVNLLGILERTLLAMLGWKGHPYIDKLSGYSLKTLNF
jgi:hypothetical protein